ncbi:MAG: NGG1p interacting factor NIF3 [Cellvibrio sp.]
MELHENELMYSLAVYVPEQALEEVKQALFSAGAGSIGNYDKCSWQVLGMGQFRALEGSDPTIGEQNKIAQVAEYRLEMVVDESIIKPVLKALYDSHPYEEPAFHLTKTEFYKNILGDDFVKPKK